MNPFPRSSVRYALGAVLMLFALLPLNAQPASDGLGVQPANVSLESKHGLQDDPLLQDLPWLPSKRDAWAGTGTQKRCLLPDQPTTCCGDGRCDPGENCARDCAVCGNGVCDITESCGSCALDCGTCAFCGDGVCNGTETCRSCSDCQNSCFLGKYQAFYRGERSESIFYNYSLDGETWYGDWTLGNGARSRVGVAATIFNDRMFVFYRGRTNEEIYVSYSDDGRNWLGNHTLGNGAVTNKSPGVAVFNNRIYLIYKDSGDSSVWLSTSTDGLNWDSPMLLFTNSFGTADAPTAFVWGNRLYLFWSHAGTRLIVSYVSTDGINFQPLPNTGEVTDYGVSIVAKQGTFFLAYVGQDGYVKVQYGNPLSGTWTAGIPVLEARATERPTIATDGDQIVLQWKGENTNKNYFAFSPDGINWLGNGESKGATKDAGPYMIYTD